MTEFSPLQGKKVVIVLGSLELGGSERQALHLARFLQGQGGHVQILGFFDVGMAASLCEEYGIPWSVFPFVWPENRAGKLGCLLRLVVALRRAKPDILVPYTVWPDLACGLVWRWSGARTCIWNQREIGVYPASERTARWAARMTPGFVANSHGAVESLIQTLGVEISRIKLIHNGVMLSPAAADRPTWRRQLGLKGDDLVACMVANITERKDHTTLLKAWRMVADCMDAKLLLAGYPGSAHHDIQTLAVGLDLCQHVQFLGQVRDISGLLGAVDIGVFSSREEGCPNGVLECMAAGLPIAGTDIPGVREAVGPPGYPFLAACEDAEALAERVIVLARDPELRSVIGEMNRLRVNTEFGLERMCRETARMLVEAMTADRLP